MTALSGPTISGLDAAVYTPYITDTGWDTCMIEGTLTGNVTSEQRQQILDLLV